MRTPSRLQHELRQRKPFRSVRQEAAIALLKTADHVRSQWHRVVEGHGITGQQYNVLRILRGAGSEGMPTLEIARRMIERTPGITRLLDRLEGKRLVRRQRCPTDRRQVLCWIEPAGLKLLAELDGPIDEADDRALSRLAAADIERLIELLETVRGEVQ